MEFIKLGNSGLEVSRLCLGTMAFGRWISEEESVAIINKAISLGINFIDTANFYGKGQDAAIPYGNGAAEEIIGRAIRNRREQLVVATKVGLPMGHGRNRWNRDATELKLYLLRQDVDTNGISLCMYS